MHEVHSQHRLQRKGWATIAPFAVIRGYQLDQGSPWNHGFHLLQKHLLAGLARAQVQVKAALFHGARVCRAGLTSAMPLGWFCRVSLEKYLKINDLNFGTNLAYFHICPTYQYKVINLEAKI
jgi:hypothetical protein